MPELVYTAGALPTVRANGLLLMGDPHLAATPPGQRLEGFMDQVLAKVHAALEHAREKNMAAIVLGDLFHWPRENPNSLLVALIELFGAFDAPCKPWVLVGNHDKYQARYTPDVSLAVLDAAGVINLMAEPGPQFWLTTPTGEAVVGATPDMDPLPGGFEKEGQETVVWCTHHNIGFRDYAFKPLKPVELPGIDWVFNGHIHRPQPTVVKGATRWVNAGGMVRMSFVPAARTRRPAVTLFRPGSEELEQFEVPIEPFEAVFPDQAFPEEDSAERESRFLAGLERLAWRRTQEGVGLKQFLKDNVDRDSAEGRLVWDLYEETTHGDA